MHMRLDGALARQLVADSRLSYVRGRRAIEAAAPGHVRAVRGLFVDRLSPSQLDAIGDAAEIVLAAFDELDMPEAVPHTKKVS